MASLLSHVLIWGTQTKCEPTMTSPIGQTFWSEFGFMAAAISVVLEPEVIILGRDVELGTMHIAAPWPLLDLSDNTSW